MNNEESLPLFAFEADNESRMGILIIAAPDEKTAYDFLTNENSRWNRYNIRFDKCILNVRCINLNDCTEKLCKLVYKNFTDI